MRFAYVAVSDYGEYLLVAKDLNLRIMDILTKAGYALLYRSTER